MAAPHVVVLGAGFGGLEFCKALDAPGIPVTLIDRQNHHLFQPLLYQVATAGLSAPDIAQPIRAILRDKRDVTVLLEEVKEIRPSEKKIILEHGEISFSHLVIALGGVTSYFGHPEWQKFAPGLKSLDDALGIRRDVLLAFERAEVTEDPIERKRLLTMVVIGGGPTGVELAGAFAELAQHVLRGDFRRIDPAQARVVLIEGSAHVLDRFPPRLSESAERTLRKMGVEIMTGKHVTDMREGVVVCGAEELHAETIVWAAGVSANPLTAQLGVPMDRGGRVKVNPDLSLPGHPEIYAIGDVVSLMNKDGTPVPGVSPAAMQMGRHVARLIGAELESHAKASAERRPFVYFDKGTMATIGRSAAVAIVGPFKFSGLLAWLAWLFIHLIFLVGFRSKLIVIVQWFFSYVTYGRGARIIVGRKTINN